MKLTDEEKAMLDGREGKARQKAMELLVRYGEALGCENFVDTTNVDGVPGQSSIFLDNYYREFEGGAGKIFSCFDLDSDKLAAVHYYMGSRNYREDLAETARLNAAAAR